MSNQPTTSRHAAAGCQPSSYHEPGEGMDATGGLCYDDGMRPKNVHPVVAPPARVLDEIGLDTAARTEIHDGHDIALLSAVYDGQVAVVKTLLAAGADIHAANDVALRAAAERGHIEIIKVLLAAGADIHADDDDALCDAAIKGHVETVRFLITAGANVRADADAPLRLAAINGHVAVAKTLLMAGADPLVAWSSTPNNQCRQDAAKALDDCADVMTPAQRANLASKSEHFVKLKAAVLSSSRRPGLQRQSHEPSSMRC